MTLKHFNITINNTFFSTSVRRKGKKKVIYLAPVFNAF